MPDAEERGFLDALKEDAKDVTTRLAYADWLEEHDRKYEAMQQRLKAGVSEARYRIRRKSDGLFSDGWRWAEKGYDWRSLKGVRGHFTSTVREGRYHGTDVKDVEVVVYEVRVEPVAALPVTSRTETDPYAREVVTVHEPKAGKTP
jgi:uncharacterized protein (TIGR02996 family)